MNFIKKIFDDNIDEIVHLQFQKFSRGEFRDRAIINARQSKGKYTITTTAEFANGLVREVARKINEEKTNVKGAIISTQDLTGHLEFQGKKQFQGVKRYLIDKEMSGNEIIDLLDKFPKAFFALSFENKKDSTFLKIKPKAPKSTKPKNKGETVKPNFCKLVTTDRELGGSFVFETTDWKNANINHIFLINDIIVSDELKSSKDFARIREEAKKKGKIIRKADIDGREITKEKEFVV